nr:MAG: hypothetical protein [Plasmopara viticola lesion associated narnavirus 3]
MIKTGWPRLQAWSQTLSPVRMILTRRLSARNGNPPVSKRPSSPATSAATMTTISSTHPGRFVRISLRRLVPPLRMQPKRQARSLPRWHTSRISRQRDERRKTPSDSFYSRMPSCVLL